MSSQDAIQALFYPFDSGVLMRPGLNPSTLFVNAQPCTGLAAFLPAHIIVQQSFRPLAASLAQSGYPSIAEIPQDRKFDLILLAGVRQHRENLFLLAAALKALRQGGLLIAASANDSGGKRLAADLAELGVSCAEMSKYKSRIVIVENFQTADSAACDAAIKAGAYQPIESGAYTSRPGVFCWDRIDRGSALLAGHIDFADLAGNGADFGCGYGFLSHQIAQNAPAAKALTCIDADAWALESCRRTLAGTALETNYLWSDIPNDETLPRNLDWIVMNPPFHAGKTARPQIGIAFIERAAQSLKPGGILWMVANSGLPYDPALTKNFTHSHKIQDKDGYRIYKAIK